MKKYKLFVLSIFLTACSANENILLTVNTPCPDKPNCVSSIKPNNFYKIEPFILTDEHLSWDKLLKLISSYSNSNIIINNDKNLYAEFRSKYLGFIDDVIMHRSGVVVDVRSSSRIGYYDFKVNINRLIEIRDDLKRSGYIK